MGESSVNGFPDQLDEFDWKNLIDDAPLPLGTDSSPASSLSPLFSEIESQLMMEDVLVDVSPGADDHFYDQFLAEILVGSPPLPQSDPEAASESSSGAEPTNDLVEKKRMRQLRNRDAALRSRERKKVYVQELESRSRYLESECRRLGRLLQCFVAENQTLRYTLQTRSHTPGVAATKQESAVLLLESLLLGSLLWFLATTTFPLSCLSPPPAERGEERRQRKIQRRAGSCKVSISPFVCSFSTSKRCKASRTRIKHPTVFCILA